MEDEDLDQLLLEKREEILFALDCSSSSSDSLSISASQLHGHSDSSIDIVSSIQPCPSSDQESSSSSKEPLVHRKRARTHQQDTESSIIASESIIACYMSSRYDKVKDFASFFTSQFNYRDMKSMKKYFSSYTRPSCVMQLAKISATAKDEYNPYDNQAFVDEMNMITTIFPNATLTPRSSRMQTSTTSKHSMLSIKVKSCVSTTISHYLAFSQARGGSNSMVDIMNQEVLTPQRIEEIKRLEDALRNANIMVDIFSKVRIKVIIDDLLAEIVGFQMAMTIDSFRISPSSLPQAAVLLADEMLSLGSSSTATAIERELLLTSLAPEMQFMLLLKKFGVVHTAGIPR
jgi:hypothetical protein